MQPAPPVLCAAQAFLPAPGFPTGNPLRQTYCCEAYNILRKSANLLLNLLHLMAGASIPDIQSDPEKAMLKLQVGAAASWCAPAAAGQVVGWAASSWAASRHGFNEPSPHFWMGTGEGADQQMVLQGPCTCATCCLPTHRNVTGEAAARPA